jgi:hypothetical protein
VEAGGRPTLVGISFPAILYNSKLIDDHGNGNLSFWDSGCFVHPGFLTAIGMTLSWVRAIRCDSE